MVSKEILMACIGKVIELLGLPGMKALTVVIDAGISSRCGHLLRKDGWVSSHLERFGCYHSRCLMVAVVLSRNIGGHPRENDLRPGQAYQAHHFIQRFSVPECLQGVQHILGSRI